MTIQIAGKRISTIDIVNSHSQHDYETINAIDLSGCLIQEYTFFEYFKNINVLILVNCKLQSFKQLPAYCLTKLKFLNVQQNQIKTMTGIQLFKDLCNLDISFNNITIFQDNTDVLNINRLSYKINNTQLQKGVILQFFMNYYINTKKQIIFKNLDKTDQQMNVIIKNSQNFLDKQITIKQECYNGSSINKIKVFQIINSIEITQLFNKELNQNNNEFKFNIHINLTRDSQLSQIYVDSNNDDIIPESYFIIVLENYQKQLLYFYELKNNKLIKYNCIQSQLEQARLYMNPVIQKQYIAQIQQNYEIPTTNYQTSILTTPQFLKQQQSLNTLSASYNTQSQRKSPIQQLSQSQVKTSLQTNNSIQVDVVFSKLIFLKQTQIQFVSYQSKTELVGAKLYYSDTVDHIISQIQSSFGDMQNNVSKQILADSIFKFNKSTQNIQIYCDSSLQLPILLLHNGALKQKIINIEMQLSDDINFYNYDKQLCLKHNYIPNSENCYPIVLLQYNTGDQTFFHYFISNEPIKNVEFQYFSAVKLHVTNYDYNSHQIGDKYYLLPIYFERELDEQLNNDQIMFKNQQFKKFLSESNCQHCIYFYLNNIVVKQGQSTFVTEEELQQQQQSGIITAEIFINNLSIKNQQQLYYVNKFAYQESCQQVFKQDANILKSNSKYKERQNLNLSIEEFYGQQQVIQSQRELNLTQNEFQLLNNQTKRKKPQRDNKLSINSLLPNEQQSSNEQQKDLINSNGNTEDDLVKSDKINENIQHEESNKTEKEEKSNEESNQSDKNDEVPNLIKLQLIQKSNKLEEPIIIHLKSGVQEIETSSFKIQLFSRINYSNRNKQCENQKTGFQKAFSLLSIEQQSQYTKLTVNYNQMDFGKALYLYVFNSQFKKHIQIPCLLTDSDDSSFKDLTQSDLTLNVKMLQFQNNTQLQDITLILQNKSVEIKEQQSKNKIISSNAMECDIVDLQIIKEQLAIDKVNFYNIDQFWEYSLIKNQLEEIFDFSDSNAYISTQFNKQILKSSKVDINQKYNKNILLLLIQNMMYVLLFDNESDKQNLILKMNQNSQYCFQESQLQQNSQLFIKNLSKAKQIMQNQYEELVENAGFRYNQDNIVAGQNFCVNCNQQQIIMEDYCVLIFENQQNLLFCLQIVKYNQSVQIQNCCAFYNCRVINELSVKQFNRVECQSQQQEFKKHACTLVANGKEYKGEFNLNIKNIQITCKDRKNLQLSAQTKVIKVNIGLFNTNLIMSDGKQQICVIFDDNSDAQVINFIQKAIIGVK